MIGAKVAVGVTMGEKGTNGQIVVRRCESDALLSFGNTPISSYLDPQRGDLEHLIVHSNASSVKLSH